MKKTKLIFQDKLPSQLDFKNCVLIYDQILEKKYSKFIRRFDRRLKVRSGEALKDLSKFPSHMREISKVASGVSVRELQIIAFGGGTVGDFAGFVASVYKRGVGFVQIPTTWLSAIDSAHGGKTALNLDQVKNQVGSFYPASKVFLIKEIFTDLPAQRILEALGEFYKIGLINGGTLWKKMCVMPTIDSIDLWKLLPLMISAKLRVVSRDPYEKTGVRHILNLGHTIGHVLESATKLAHGEAVHYGLRFAYEFGRQQKLTPEISELEWMLPTRSELSVILRKVKKVERLLAADKKSVGHNRLRFVFISKPGKIIVHEVPILALVQEWKRQAR